MKPASTLANNRLEKKLSAIFLGCLLALPFAASAQQGTYVSPPIVGNPAPNVNATNFINAGIWNINNSYPHVPYSPLPYQTFNTLNYTNTGTMNGSIGWEFDHGPNPPGVRGWSANFFNDNNATVYAEDGFVVISPVQLITVSHLLISATNIFNKGTLMADANGEIVLNGSEVNLSRSFFEITPVAGTPGGGSTTSTNFVPDTAISDLYWLGATNKLNVGGPAPAPTTAGVSVGEPVWDGTNVVVFTATKVVGANLPIAPCGTTNATENIGPLMPQVSDSLITNAAPTTLTLTNAQLGGTDPKAFSTTNITVYAGVIRQAVFVYLTNANITATIHFVPSSNLTNPVSPMAVQFATVSTNQVTGALQTNTIYVVDSLGSITNTTLLRNTVVSPSAICANPTFRPATVIVSRADPTLQGIPDAFASGAPGMGAPTNSFFDDPSFTNLVPVGVADAYSAFIDNLAAEPPAGFSITNAPGKIQIFAKDLNLSRTRMSATSTIQIQAANLVSSAGAVMDCQNLSYNLGSTNGFLNVTNLVVQNVQRLNGTVKEWSGLWTNGTLGTTYANYAYDNTSSNWVLVPITIGNTVQLVIMVVDARGLITTVPVTVQDLILHSTNMVVSDSMTVTNALLFDGQSLTLQGNLKLIVGVQNWNNAIAPTLRFFTNNGFLDIPHNADFGDDGPTNYAAFVNHGSIFSGGQTISSGYLEINGATNIAFANNFTATCQTGLVMNAEISAAGDIQFYANSLTIDPSILFAGGAIDFTVTNSLSDGGFGNGNTFTCKNGFNLPVKPTTGDLLGTTIIDTALAQDEVDHVWAGHDFGVDPAGYSDNVAIGRLVLNQNSTVSFFTPLFYFAGANANNGLYVSNLDLSTLTDYANELEIDPNLVIYFISAKLNPNVDITPFPSVEAFLDGQLGGHLRWAQGVTIPASPAIVTSISGGMVSKGKFQFNVNCGPGSANQTNVIQASTNLVNWVSIYTNIGSTIFTDTTANGYPRRFYRVKPWP